MLSQMPEKHPEQRVQPGMRRLRMSSMFPSSSCQRNIGNNICSPECDVPECPPCYPPPPPPPKTTPPPPPTCSSTCLRNIRNNVCSPQCEVPECPPCAPPPPPQQEPPTCSS